MSPEAQALRRAWRERYRNKSPAPPSL